LVPVEVGELRYLTGETVTNCYRHFMDTEELTNQNQGRSRPFFPVSQPVQDFLDIRHENFYNAFS
jgi:hypothetical protein